MCTKYFFKHLAAISILFGTILSPLCVNAGTEYVVGLTAQGIRNASLEEIEVGFNYQLANLTKGKDYAMKIKVYPTVNQLSDAINSKKVIGYFGPPLMFLKYKNTFDADLLFSPVLSEKVLQRYIFLVRKDAGIDGVEKLKNLTLSYCETDEVGIFFLQKLLQDKKLGLLESYFSKMVVKKTPSLAISALFFKETQATIVLESDFTVATELNPQLSKHLIAIETSPEYITNLLAVRKDFEGPMTKQDFEVSAKALGSAIASKKMLKNYNYGALSKIQLQDLNSVNDLIKSLGKNKGAIND
jgi:hypothetical protein